MLAANNPPAINVTDLKSNSEKDPDGLSKGFLSGRNSKNKGLKLKLDRSS
jgi:hypothetical protein